MTDSEKLILVVAVLGGTFLLLKSNPTQAQTNAPGTPPGPGAAGGSAPGAAGGSASTATQVPGSIATPVAFPGWPAGCYPPDGSFVGPIPSDAHYCGLTDLLNEYWNVFTGTVQTIL